MELRVFVQPSFAQDEVFHAAKESAVALRAHLERDEVVSLIHAANQPGMSSAAVQEVLLEKATELGFSSEKQGLFKEYSTSGLRPDYYKTLGEGSGILLEVERGKTTINNMDLLDLWKCHICTDADVLFLFVPLELRQNPEMSPRREFATVSSRLESFFEPGNETNVKALFLFGY
jgi:hypothetical protein